MAAKKKVKAKPKKGVQPFTDPIRGTTAPHSAAYRAARNRLYEQTYGPLNLTGPMGPSDVAKSIDAATNQKFNPQFQTISDQVRQSQGQDKNLTDWYGNYKRDIANAYNQTAAANQQALDFTNRFADTSSNVDASQRGQIAQQNAASAASRGQATDPNQAFVGQQADQSRRAAAGQFGSLIGAQGANAAGYAANRGAIASGQELQGHVGESNRRQNLALQTRQLQAQRGDYRTTLRGQLQASERQNQLAVATLLGSQANQAAQRATDQQRLGLTARGQDITARGQNLSSADRRAAQQEAARHNRTTESQGQQKINNTGKGGSGGLTPTQKRTLTTQQRNATNFLSSYRIPLPDGSSRGLSRQWDFTGAGYQNTVDAVRRNAHVPYQVARAAVDSFMKAHWPSLYGKRKKENLNKGTY